MYPRPLPFCLHRRIRAGEQESTSAPRIVNVINFIRQTEPRIDAITDEVLYRTVVEQVKLLNRYGIKGTYLLQYDALISPSYQELLKKKPCREQK